jgi:hypothetical protein
MILIFFEILVDLLPRRTRGNVESCQIVYAIIHACETGSVHYQMDTICPEGRDSTFLRNVGKLYRTTWCHIIKCSALHLELQISQFLTNLSNSWHLNRF